MNPASVAICQYCHEHGRIVFPDGTKSREFWTRHMGFEVIIGYQEGGQLSEQEASELGRQVSASGLPKDKSEIRHSDKVCPEFQALTEELSKIQRASRVRH